MRLKGFWIVLGGIGLLISGCAGIKIHPDFDHIHPELQSIAIIEPEVEAYELTYNSGAKPIPYLQEMMKQITVSNIETVLTKKGYKITQVPITEAMLQSDLELKNAFFELRTLYLKALDDIKKRKKKEFTYTVGEVANYFGSEHNVNALIVFRQRGTVLSSGEALNRAVKRVASLASSLLFAVTYELSTELAVIDADLGEVLWYNIRVTRDQYNNPARTSVVSHRVKELVEPFPEMVPNEK